MTTTFEVHISAAEAHIRFADWKCRVERLDDQTCNIVFFDQAEWTRFEEYAEEHGYRLV